MATIISYKSIVTERGTKLWFVTYDNRILGDSRPFDTADQAREEALKAVDHAGCENYVRRAIYRPGY